MIGKTIRIYLPSGDSSGIWIAEIINRTPQFIVGSKLQIDELAARPELRRPGVYCLIGKDPDDPDTEKIYIGQGEDVYNRIKSHLNDESKDFWEKTAIVVSKDENLTTGHILYIETQLIKLAKKANRVSVINVQQESNRNLPEPEISSMDDIIDMIKLVFPALGFNFLEPSTEVRKPELILENQIPVFILTATNIEAIAIELEGKFIVQSNSTAKKTTVRTLPASYRKLRDKLIKERKLMEIDDEENLQFVEDVVFSSPSAAACVISGSSVNGRQLWKLKDTEKTYADWLEDKLSKVKLVSTKIDDIMFV